MSITLQEVMKARSRISSYIRHTPLEYTETLSQLYNADIYFKLENLQVTGSFKPRGSLNKLLTLDQTQQTRGVIAPSAGNHGIGLAYASSKLGIPAYVYLPQDTDRGKIKTLNQYGVSLKFFDSIESARQAAMKDAEEEGYIFLSAYNDRSVIAANGTIALEILEDLPDVDTVIVCVGGGGLASGIGTVLKAVNPSIEVWGVQTTNSPTLAVWFEQGKVTPVDLKPSIAEGLSGPIDPDTITFPIIQKCVDRILTVTDAEIIDAMKIMINEHRYIVEPSGAAGIAALHRYSEELSKRKIAVTVTGRNISWNRLQNLIK
ncbi:threonine ammonia-lyase [Polycladomyces subterraneus]|uniref:Threonine/serine dehydratase n=1 Tax=Polycladomyces subterraneus TaxID=1016997 RepID=A0ABT8IKL8_9BACL|nr:threonine/serine dehydratase [Polycladomyces subterraneus]MDN4593322.1 threonine/serine dehydratase [Polycladomyces subterraneus]